MRRSEAAILALILAAAGGGTLAQETPSRSDLEAVERQSQATRARTEALTVEAERLAAERLALTESLRDTAAGVREAERRLDALDREIAALEPQLAAQSASLSARRGELAASLSALAALARTPALAAVARPGGFIEAGLAATALSGLTPELQADVTALGRDLAELQAGRKRLAGARTEAAVVVEAAARDRERLAALLAEKAESASGLRAAAAVESVRLMRLAERERTLGALLDRLAPLTETATAPDRPRERVAVASLRGRLPRPAEGTVVARFGEAAPGAPDDRQGIVLSTRPGALVTAPADGTVRFSGPFRSYGRLLIMDLGDGYHLLVAGLVSTEVAVGQWVLAGEPVGAMEAPGSGARPELYMELRHDGTPVDPMPWLAPTEGKISG